MSETLPKDFKDLKPTELYRAAIEDFALPVEEDDKNKKTVLLAAFVEGGVTWADYVAQHPEVAPVQEVVTNPNPVNQQSLSVDSAVPLDPENKWAEEVEEEEPEARIITAELPKYKPKDKLLIKMDRKNPLFEVRGHRFTQENPYALMSPEDADYVLRFEDGFRQALPSELQEFYG